MIKLFENTPMIQDARNSGRGGKLWKEILMVILMAGIVFFALSLIESIPVILLFADLTNPDAMMTDLQEINATVASLYLKIFSSIIFVLFCRFGQKRSFESFGFKTKGAIWEYGKGLVIGFIMFAAVVAIGEFFDAYYLMDQENKIDYVMIATIFGGFIIQGAQEEILCRGYIMTSIARKNNVWLAVIINSIVFALLHMGNAGLSIWAIVNLFLFGVFMSVYMLRTNSIMGACAIHTIWNFVQGSFFGLSVSGLDTMPSIFRLKPIGSELLTGGEFGPEGSVATTAILIVSIALIIVPMIIKSKGVTNGKSVSAADQPAEEH